MPRPKLPHGQKRRSINVTLSPEALRDLQRLARGARMVPSRLIEDLIRAEVARQEKRPQGTL